MWTEMKILLCISVCLASTFMYSQTSAKTTASSSTNKNIQKPVFNSKPTISKSEVDNIFSQIKNKLITNKWPKNISNAKSAKNTTGNKQITLSEYFLILTNLRKLVLNPDLEEVSGYRKTWFVKLGKSVAAFERYIIAADSAIDSRNNRTYQKVISYFPALANQVNTILNAPEKLSKTELEQLKIKNYNRRVSEYRKKQAEYWKQQQKQQGGR